MFGFGRREKDPNRVELKPWQRLVGIGANVLFPGAGVASNMIFNGMNNRQQTPINPNTMQGWNTSPNLGFGMSPMQPSSPGASVTNQQLSDRFDANPSINLAARQNPDSGLIMGGAGQFIQPNQQSQHNVDQLYNRAMANPWIRHNGLPTDANGIRMAINSQYLDQATDLANSNYGQDIAYMTPHARTPRQA